MNAETAFDRDLDQCAANHQPLSPLGFLDRASLSSPSKIAIVHGGLRITYRQFRDRCHQLASALAAAGAARGDTVSVMLTNTPPMLEAHYGVPMCGAVLNCINIRLDAPAIAYILKHSETKVLIVDREFRSVMEEAIRLSGMSPLLIDYHDTEHPVSDVAISSMDYEAFVVGGSATYEWSGPSDEWDAITLNYTSGTTGEPKGVVYHHRGAYLLAIGNGLAAQVNPYPVYLWTLPMFHCNGFCFPWTITLLEGTHVCLRKVRSSDIYRLIAEQRVTHMTGAPIVMSTILDAKADERRPINHPITFITGAAPPPPSVLKAMEEAGFRVIHFYGLTETHGPVVVNVGKPEWESLPEPERFALEARQGIRFQVLESLDVIDPTSTKSVQRDGISMGEVVLRGNVVMKGYLKQPAATAAALADGWFHTGDLGVIHPDGMMEIKDREKDIIISGGENISSIEIENVLYQHPAVQSAAVVAKPDPRWGETPCAFVEPRSGMTVTEAELELWCKERMASFKCPRAFVISEVPKTLTGKIQKFKVREMMRNLLALHVIRQTGEPDAAAKARDVGPSR